MSIDVTSDVVAEISADKANSNESTEALTAKKSALVAAISVDKAALFDKTYAAKAPSFVVSTALIKETISTNESLSASDANKIASILPFSVETRALTEIKSASVALISTDKALVKTNSAASALAFSIESAAA